MLTLRLILRANTDRLTVIAAAAMVGVAAGIGVVYLVLSFGGDRIASL